MKKMSKRFSRVLGLVLVFAMMFSVGSVYAGESSQPDEFSAQVGHMLGVVAQDAQAMGMSGTNFDNLYLGECVHIKNGISFYPIFEGENGAQVATISTWLDESGARQLQFEQGVAQDIAENSPTANSNTTKLYTISTYATTGKTLNVPVVGQGSSSRNMLCWAACTSAVGMYKTGIYKSPLSVAQSVGQSETSGGNLIDIQAALGINYGILSSVYEPGALTSNIIISNINNGIPLVVGTQAGHGSVKHTVVIRGYVSDYPASTQHYITYMDPDGSGTSKTVTMAQNGVFKIYYPFDGNESGYSERTAYGYVTLR